MPAKPYTTGVRQVDDAARHTPIPTATRRRDATTLACGASVSAANRIVDAPSSGGGRVVPDRTGVRASDHDCRGRRQPIICHVPIERPDRATGSDRSAERCSTDAIAQEVVLFPPLGLVRRGGGARGGRRSRSRAIGPHERSGNSRWLKSSTVPPSRSRPASRRRVEPLEVVVADRVDPAVEVGERLTVRRQHDGDALQLVHPTRASRGTAAADRPRCRCRRCAG